MTRLAAHRLRIARDAVIRDGRHDLRLMINNRGNADDQADQNNRIDADQSHHTR